MAKKVKEPATGWEIKDRLYTLKNNKKPLTYTIKSRGMFWFDEEKGYERELKYTVNQKSPFVDEFTGPGRLAHITFEDGVLNVPKEKQTYKSFYSFHQITELYLRSLIQLKLLLTN